MSALDSLALALYAIGYALAFVRVANWIAEDQSGRSRQKRDPAWLNGGASMVAALFWPVILIFWLIGRLYVLTAGED